jgi:hypothetical protein
LPDVLRTIVPATPTSTPSVATVTELVVTVSEPEVDPWLVATAGPIPEYSDAVADARSALALNVTLMVSEVVKAIVLCFEHNATIITGWFVTSVV